MSFFHEGAIPALDSDGNPISGATWNFYLEGTLTAASVYSDSDLTTPVGSTVTSNAAGRFANIYLSENFYYRAILKDAGGATIKDIDPLNEIISTSYTAPYTGAQVRTLLDRAEDTVSVKDFGAVGDGVTDDTTEFQAAIDAMTARGGGTILVPIGSYVVGDVLLKSGVFLQGGGAATGYIPSSVYTSRLIAKTASSWVIDTPAAQQLACGVRNLDIQGLGAGPVMGGVRIRDGKWCRVVDCNISNFGEQGILHTAGVAPWITGNFVLNCVLNRTRAAKTGAIEIGSATADHYLHDNEVTASVSGAVTSASLYCCSAVIAGANGFMRDNVFETSDVGCHVSGANNRFSNDRADRNRGHGWEVTGSSNVFSGCLSLDNGLAAANTYDNWSVSGANNRFSAIAATTSASQARYGVYDSSPAGDSDKNYYDTGCLIQGTYGTMKWLFVNGIGPSRVAPSGYPKTMTANSTTPNIEGFETWRTANTNPTSITNFLGCVTGEYRTIFCFDANTTLIHNGGLLVLKGGVSRVLRNNEVVRLQLVSAVWREVGDFSYNANTTVDPGSLALGASSTAATITVTGAAMGDFVQASFSNSVAGIVIHAWVSAADTVSYYFTNQNGTNPLDLASGTLRVRVNPK